MSRNPRVDDLIRRASDHARPVLRRLREIVHGAVAGLEEEIKWGAPTFMKSGMVCSMHGFKSYVGLWFHKGAMLKDPSKLLQPGVTARVMKSVKLTSADEIDEAGIAELVRQAVALNESGAKPRAPGKSRPVLVPAALKKALARSPKAKAFFDSLAPSHRREYSDYIAEAKKPETIERRLAKTIAELEKGMRPHEKYRKKRAE